MFLAAFIVLLLSPSIVYTRLSNSRPRRTSQPRRNVPFVIRVPPLPKISPINPLFSHSVAWKAKQPSKKSDDGDVQVTQFHSQDSNGQVVFGFNGPDQMRIETRSADGSIHGTYSYLDPYGQIVKRQYWDTGDGFHVTSNSYLMDANNTVQHFAQPIFTPEVQAVRDLHYQLYQQALSSLLPIPQRTEQVTEVSNALDPSSTISHDHYPENTSTTSTEHVVVVNEEINPSESNAEDGSIVIQNPEYLRISWSTDNKKFRINLYNETHRNNHTNVGKFVPAANVTNVIVEDD